MAREFKLRHIPGVEDVTVTLEGRDENEPCDIAASPCPGRGEALGSVDDDDDDDDEIEEEDDDFEGEMT